VGVRLGRGKCWRAQKSLNERAPGTRLPTCPQPSPFPPTRCQDLCGLRKSLECTFISISDFRNHGVRFISSPVQSCIQYSTVYSMERQDCTVRLSCLSCPVSPVQDCTVLYRESVLYSPVRTVLYVGTVSTYPALLHTNPHAIA